jgi:cytochrome c biogenesis protein CcmG, thiol:disulfide interchange protein DsbE
VTQNPSNTIKAKKSVSLWIQILIGISALIVLWLAFLLLVGLGLFKAQHPILGLGSKVSDFNLTLFDAYPYQNTNQVRLSDLRGKVVVVNFWASWCVTCADEAAYLETAWRHYKPDGQVIFLGVDYTDVDSKALEYLKKFDITYPNGPDLGTRITPIFNRNIAMPETYIIDQQGILRHEQIGPFQSVAELQSVIDPLLAGR